MISAVLFDADGVLVDACELHYQALNRALATMGWHISRQDHETTYNGLPTYRKLELLTQHKGFPSTWHHAVHALKQEFTWEALDDCLTFDPDKRELLLHMRSHDIKIAVCSNAMRKTLDRMLYRTGIADCINLVIGGDDVAYPKPAPDMYLLAARELNVPISKCTIVEDSEVGLRAAIAAKPGTIVKVKGPQEVRFGLLGRLLPRALAQEAA